MVNRRVLVPLVVLALTLAGAAAAPAAVVINEIESDQGVPGDWVEFTNTGAAAVSIDGYVVRDDNDANAPFTVPDVPDLAPGGFYALDVSGLGASDSARLFAPGDLATPVDNFTWDNHAPATFGRCPDGSGLLTFTTAATKGAANACPSTEAWPGGPAVATVDDTATFADNMSGLAYKPSGTSAPGVLYAVRNNPGTLYRLLWDGTKWAPDTQNGWAAGKALHYPDGSGNPDAEGITFAAGDPTGIYASVERDGSGNSRPAILRFDISGSAATLNATNDYELTDLTGLGANLGPEAVGFIPDSVLVAKGFLDPSTGLPYLPANYPGHGFGLFFAGVEQDGSIHAYALNRTNNTWTAVATFSSGFSTVMDLTYEPERNVLWAACDDNCADRANTLDVATAGADAGKFVVTHTYERPAGFANMPLNNEGFAIAPRTECANNLKPVIWADDSDSGGHALRQGTISCTPGTDPSFEPTPTVTATATPTTTAQPTVTATPTTTPVPDTKAPVLSAVKATRKQISFTISENARLKVTVKKKGSFSVAVKKGRRTVRFKGHIAAKKLRKGRLSITLVATDPAGNRSKAKRVGVG